MSCYMHDSAWRWGIVENAKVNWIYVELLGDLPPVRNGESWLGYANNFSSTFLSYFLTETIK